MASVDLDGTASAAASVSATTIGRRNLCTNPHADVDTSGWSVTGGTISRATGATGFPKSTVIDASNVTATVTTAPGAVTPGETYVASLGIKPNNAIGDQKLYLEWRDSGGGVLSYTSGPTIALSNNVMNRVEMSGTAPASAAFVAVLMADMFGARQVGAVLIEPGTVASAYADGDTSTWVWSGTTGVSDSYQLVTVDQLTVARDIAGSSHGSAATTGDMSRSVGLTGTSEASGHATGLLGVLRALVGQAFATAEARGSLSITSGLGSFGGYRANLLDRGKEPVTVFPEEVSFDADGNTWTRASTTGVDTMAVVQVAAASGTSSRRSEQDNEGYETEENWRIRFPRDFPIVLGAQAKVQWRGLMYSVVGDARRYNGSSRTAHIEYTIRRA